MGGVNIHDAWDHGVMPYTTTGVFGKSSNVGTLMLAQRVGPERFYDMVRKFGLGQRTNVGLPGESAGLVPPIDQWSGSTFSNLPIGQGLSMTLLQMTGMYQTIANDGVRMPPRIIKATIAADGTRTEEPRPEGVRVVSPQTAQTVRSMLRAVVQRDPMGYQQGTGPAAAVPGYQMAGKTGTAQQINPGCGCYFDNVYWITFAGMATVDNPRYVIGIMMDNPQRNADGTPGHSAAPLFHNIAGWLMQRENVPLSPDPGSAADPAGHLADPESSAVAVEPRTACAAARRQCSTVRLGRVSWPIMADRRGGDEECRCPLRCGPAPAPVRGCRRWRLRSARYRPTAVAAVPDVADHRCDAAGPGRAARRPVRRPARRDHARRAVRRRRDRTRRRRGAHRCRRAWPKWRDSAPAPVPDTGAPRTPQRARRPGRHGVRATRPIG